MRGERATATEIGACQESPQTRQISTHIRNGPSEDEGGRASIDGRQVEQLLLLFDIFFARRRLQLYVKICQLEEQTGEGWIRSYRLVVRLAFPVAAVSAALLLLHRRRIRWLGRPIVRDEVGVEDAAERAAEVADVEWVRLRDEFFVADQAVVALHGASCSPRTPLVDAERLEQDMVGREGALEGEVVWIYRAVLEGFRLELGKFVEVDLQEMKQPSEDFKVAKGACGA